MTCNLNNDFIKRNLNMGEFGLEKESLRVDENGFLSHTKHPFEEENITRDFCENQTELITDVFDNVDDVLLHLQQLQTKVLHTLQQMESGREVLWPFSNPPYVRGESDIPVAQFEGEQEVKTEYRNYLAGKYGKRKMLFSGIHLNYSLADDMLREGYQKFISNGKNISLQEGNQEFLSKDETSSLQEDISAYRLYKDTLYLQLAKKVTMHSWFLVYLTAASPVMDPSILECDGEREGNSVWKKDDLTRYASVRCGELGYWNDFIPVFNYDSLDCYVQSIESYVHSGQLKSASELYYPVRLKPRGENSLEHLRENGISHIELRMLDVNPLSPIGLIKEDVEFIHYFMLYLLYQRDVELTEEEQVFAIINEKQAALFNDSRVFIKKAGGEDKQIRKAALEILQNMEVFYETLGENRVLNHIQYQKDKLLLASNRYADRIRKDYGTDYVRQGIQLAARYADELLSRGL